MSRISSHLSQLNMTEDQTWSQELYIPGALSSTPGIHEHFRICFICQFLRTSRTTAKLWSSSLCDKKNWGVIPEWPFFTLSTFKFLSKLWALQLKAQGHKRSKSYGCLVLLLCDPIDGRPPGFPVPGSLQARTLEWIAISFSNAWMWRRSVVSDSATPWTVAYQAPPSMGFSRQEYGSGVPLSSPRAAWGTVKSASGCNAADVTFTWVYSSTVLAVLWGKNQTQIPGEGGGL